MQADATSLELRDLIGDDLGLAGGDGVEQIGIGHEAQALIPGVVTRREVGFEIIVSRQQLCEAFQQQFPYLAGVDSRLLVEILAERDILPAHDVVRHLRGQDGFERIGDGIAAGAGHHPRGGALQHGDVRGGIGHRRHQRDRRGARSDDHDALAFVVERFRPELRVDDLALELGLTLPRGPVALAVIVITAAHVEEAAGEGGLVGGDRPARGLAVPRGVCHLVAEADVLVDAMLGRGFADVAADRRAVGDGLGRFPRLEAIAQRVHVGIRADAGITEQIPGAADGVAAFQDGIGFVRAILLQMNRRANARQAGANNQNVEISGTHGTLLPLRERKARAGWRQWGKTARAATNRHSPAAAGYRRGAPGSGGN